MHYPPVKEQTYLSRIQLFLTTVTRNKIDRKGQHWEEGVVNWFVVQEGFILDTFLTVLLGVCLMTRNGRKGYEHNNKSNIPTVFKKKISKHEQRYTNKELVNTTDCQIMGLARRVAK